MLNVINLEKRHKKYKLKLILPYILLVSILIIASLIAFFNYNNEENEINKAKVKETVIKTPIHEENLSKQISIVEIKKPTNIIEEKTISIPEAKITNKKLKLSPSMDFMKIMQSDTIPYYETKKEKTIQEVQEIKKITKVKKSEKKPILKVEKKTSLKIKRNKTNDDIKDVIRRFKNNNNPALSLFVAKKYYQIGDYHKAYNYALITNQINNNIEASWIIFAKSLVKLDKKDKAVKTLKRYIDNSHSSRAKILLDEIQSGKFK